MQINKSYCNNLIYYSRFLTREVKVGDIGIGGNNPIRIQSMTTTDTMDTVKTVEQSIRMIEAGCELVRITAPSIKEAKNLENIKKELHKRGYSTPLIADIHFTPNAAELAAKIVEKVRVNPGNYADKKKFEQIDYSDAAYYAELERIRERFTPLVKICKEYGTAMRIGTNHGSLSDRIMSRYGDTPHGMVESAMEFLRICEDEGYYDIVLSMKASNPQVMVQAYRLLVSQMIETGRNYPLHLGVTEAGEGEDGRIKSALGIGTLLEDGLGDTIRVSLTEDPEFEIPVAKMLVERYEQEFKVQGSEFRVQSSEFRVQGSGFETQNPKLKTRNPEPKTQNPKPETVYSPYEYKKRETFTINNIGANNVPRVIADFSHKQKITLDDFSAVGYNYSSKLDKWNLSDQACDYIFLGDNTIDFEIPGTLGLIYNADVWAKLENKVRSYPLFTLEEYIKDKRNISEKLNFIAANHRNLTSHVSYLTSDNKIVLVLETNSEHSMAEQRAAFLEMSVADIKNPVIIKRNYSLVSEEQLQLYSSTDLGGLLLDGFGDGIWISAQPANENSLQCINSTSFGILQATRTRISKTEYISCPSCGRTLFDLQETTAKIRSRTDHLKGVKIGIMGCIVNGPGEMADADYGYVGTGVGKITLYKGKEVVKRNIPSAQAVDALIELIKEHGDWVEKAEELRKV